MHIRTFLSFLRVSTPFYGLIYASTCTWFAYWLIILPWVFSPFLCRWSGHVNTTTKKRGGKQTVTHESWKRELSPWSIYQFFALPSRLSLQIVLLYIFFDYFLISLTATMVIEVRINGKTLGTPITGGFIKVTWKIMIVDVYEENKCSTLAEGRRYEDGISQEVGRANEVVCWAALQLKKPVDC